MRGFTGEYYEGIPVFIREEYEDEHRGMSEIDRLNEYLGTGYDNPAALFAYVEKENKGLLYRQTDLCTDMALRDYEEWELMWKPYKSGWVHKVTGEYAKGGFPDRDSYPFWCLKAPGSYADGNPSSVFSWGLTDLAAGLAVLTALGRLSDESEDCYDDDEEDEDDDDDEE